MKKKRLLKRKRIVPLFFLCLSIIGFTGLFLVFYKFNALNNDQSSISSSNSSVVLNTQSNSGTVTDVVKPPKELNSSEKVVKTAVIRMVGDNLIHEPVANSGLRSDGTYNYDHLFENIKDDISQADIAIINQETVLGGTEMGILGYPRFNSPQEIGDAIVAAGFNVVQHANNHAMDQNEVGITKTMEFWNKHPDITVVGVSMSEEERSVTKIVDANGIKVAILSYTTSLNGLPLPSGKPWMIHMLDYEEVTNDIKKAHNESDFVIVLPHWGVEYSHAASEEQKRAAQVMADAGADLIIGTHPHVIEPIEWVSRSDGSGDVLVYYSLGNYVSNQSRPARMLGGMAEIIIEKNNENVSISSAGIVPLVTHYEWGNLQNSYSVYKLKDYTDDMAMRNGVLYNEFDSEGNKIPKVLNMNWLQTLSKEVLGEWYK